jgi:hypothetical protein
VADRRNAVNHVAVVEKHDRLHKLQPHLRREGLGVGVGETDDQVGEVARKAVVVDDM